MTTDLNLFTTTSQVDIEDVIYSISDLDDEDFNGNNGDEFTSDGALEEGFESDKDYTVDYLLRTYKGKEPTIETIQSIVDDYCEELFRDSNYYADYKTSCFKDNNRVVISVAWVVDI